ncbi:CYTH and CHAD domain-containing protein [Micromonospora endolithica]|uniref:CHAD domain-containing protein n=1 Tax=Micromonospora endolithica TaxID=230091 RepID=A0A3A9ZPA3_9ACTN|nr:CYTH and CHAD domain-containing protein [Micromonospora endolithica]RKN49376.1 CHAD domain-containing protein [Micromonospora endolithica]TWJ23566.1 inorganic triphosphatase YgiF [Micromonospora endolithica]
MVEEERKYAVDEDWVLPDLSAVAPAGGGVRARPAVTLVATYVDTVDLRLARAGVSLRHRAGDEPPWTVKLPTGSPGVRHEISRPGPVGAPPAELAELVTVFHRGAPLAPVAVVRTVRTAYDVHDAAGTVLAEVVDDQVTVRDDDGATTGAFRELEAERKAGDGALLDRIGAALREAGARDGGFTPKHVRALGPAAAGEPDLAAPAGLPAAPTGGDVVTEGIRREVRRLLAHDPLARLRAPGDDGDTAVHQMRVACRRLRGDLKTFARLLRPSWARPLRDELTWLAGSLGAARDAEVLRERLRRTASADPTSPLDGAAVDRLDDVLARRQADALAAVDAALRSARYVALVDALVLAARSPVLTARAGKPARRTLPRLVARRWRRLAGHGSHPGSVAGLERTGPDEQWHDVRKEGKRVRAAVKSMTPVLGDDARELNRRLGRVQDVLGEHQDAAVAAETWLSVAAGRPDDHELAITAGRLAERERAAVHRARADFPAAWRRASRRRRTRWLR